MKIFEFMYQYLCRLYFKISEYFGRKSLIKRIYIRFMNVLLPFYFKYRPNKPFLNKCDNPQFIVSLTTFPARIDKVWLVIESILHQTHKPDLVLLWLYDGEFSDINNLPKELLKLQKRGLEIRFCKENLMPHKKYYYTMLEFPQAKIITIDDDMLFDFNLIEILIKFNIKYPKEVLCIITRKINVLNNQIFPYVTWKQMNLNSEPSFSLLTMGGGGTLFPPDSLHKDLFNINILKQKALMADDLWLKIMSLKAGTKVVSLAGEFNDFFIPILNFNDIKLSHTNINEGKNDLVFDDLLKFYKIPLNVLNDNYENNNSSRCPSQFHEDCTDYPWH